MEYGILIFILLALLALYSCVHLSGDLSEQERRDANRFLHDDNKLY